MEAGSLTSQFALDIASVGKLRSGASGKDNESSLRAAAEQFEAMFLQQMLTSMRDATMKSDLLGSSQTEFFDSLMDQQWAQQMAGAGVGLADQLVRQLSEPAVLTRLTDGSLAVPSPSDIPASMSAPGVQFFDRLDALSSSHSVPLPQSTDGAPKRGFIEAIAAHARTVETETGVPAELMVAQAVLETGWGTREIRREDGSNAHNLFGMKANADWSGDAVDVVTHEYIGERRVEVTARFRAYDSYREAFADYARLISQNPRYSGVVEAATSGEAINALLEGGYATDPAYGGKLQALIDQGLEPKGGA